MRLGDLRALLLLPLLVGATARVPARADDASVDLTEARVLASTGWPAALEGFLPPGREVEPLTLPLPAGPLLVLGLWESDPVARQLAASLLQVEPEEGLGGGYVVSARRESDRPLALVIGEDAAALAAARFELETFTPAPLEGAARKVDVLEPDQQGGVRVLAGLRRVTPRYRLRALGGLDGGEGPLDVAAARGNRLWMDVVPGVQGRPRSFSLLAEHGVLPVATAGLGAGSSVESLLAWQAKGVRHFAVSATRAREVESIAAALRPGGLAELLVVVPPGIVPPRLAHIPEALLGWTGPSRTPLAITLDQARAAVRASDVPVVLVETWMQASRALPSLPRGRDERLGEVLDGIVVLEGPGGAEALAQAWDGTPTGIPRPELVELLGCCALDAAEPRAFLLRTADTLEQALGGRYADPLWLRTLPQTVRDAAASWPDPAHLVVARYVPASVEVDGRLDDRAWAHALPRAFGPAELLALSDGEELVLGLRIPDGVAARELVLSVGAAHDEVRVPIAEVCPTTTNVSRWAVGRRGAAREVEVALGHYALSGDPHPARRITLDLRLVTADGEVALAPPGPPGGSVVIVR